MEMVGRIVRLLGKKVLLVVASAGRGRLATVGCWTEEAWLVWICCRRRIASPWPDLAVAMSEVLAAVRNQGGEVGGGGGGGTLPIVGRMGRGDDAGFAMEAVVVAGGSSSCSEKTMEKEGGGSCCRRSLARLLPNSGWMRRTGRRRCCCCLAVGACCWQVVAGH
ncbi:hypothetical protein ACLOJK_003875 [Asimina triloba]